MLFVATSSSLMLLFQGHAARQNFNPTGSPIYARRDLHVHYSTVSLYITLSFPTGESTLNSQTFLFPILSLLFFINSICFIHTAKYLVILSSKVLHNTTQHYDQTNMKDIVYDNQTK